MKHKSTMHLLHLFLCIITSGLWIFVWVWRASVNSTHNKRLEINIQRDQLDILHKIYKMQVDKAEGKVFNVLTQTKKAV